MEQSGQTKSIAQQTIEDFGDQWQRYTDNDGYYGSTAILTDTFGPLLSLDEVKGLRTGEIGAGTGRIIGMLLDAGAAHAVAIEPSAAFEVLGRNLDARRDRVTLLNVPGDRIPAGLELDLILSIGVIHHIHEPDPVMRAALGALKPGGRCLVWLYGREGNETVVTVVEAMRAVTTRLPHWALAVLAQVCTIIFDIYSALVRVLPFRMPLKDYIVNVIGKFSRQKRYLVIYDQLKPAYAKYYTREEARSLLERAGFVDVKEYHRRSYSWTVIGTRPG